MSTTPRREHLSSAPIQAQIIIGEVRIQGVLITMEESGVAVMTTEEVDVSALGCRLLGRAVKEELAAAFGALNSSPSLEDWNREISRYHIDLTAEESSALYDEFSSDASAPPPSLPGWASCIVEEAEEGDFPPSWIFGSETWVAFVSFDALSQEEHDAGDDDDIDRADSAVRQVYTFISKVIVSRVTVGAAVSVELGLNGAPTVAVLHRYEDRSQGVIEADAIAADDHYNMPPPPPPPSVAATTTTTTAIGGRVISCCTCSAVFSAVLVETTRGKFWVPTTLAFPVQLRDGPTDGAPSEDSAGSFGQHGSDFYVNRAGERLHIATALKILQRWVDEVSHNRGERFRNGRAKDEKLDLTPLSHYAIKRETPRLNGLTYTTASLGTLSRVAEGSASAPVHTANYDTPNLEGQFTFYDLADDGSYRRSGKKTKSEKLTQCKSRIIMRVDLGLSDVFNGGLLSATTKAKLAELGFIDPKQAQNLVEATLTVPKKRRGA